MRDLIAEGRRLLAEATPGPFAVSEDNGVFAHMQSLHRLAPGKDGWRERVASNMQSGNAAVAAWALNNLPALLDALEAAQRPPLGYEVVSKRPSRRDPGAFEYSSAGSIWPDREPVDNHRGYCEDLAAADPDRHGAAGDYIVVELREVQP